MDVNWIFLRSFFLSLVLHTLLIALLIFSVDTAVKKVASPAPQVNIVKAVSVDKKQVEKELKRLKDIEKEKLSKELKKQKELERKLKELENKAAKVKKNRKSEEKKLAELKKKKVEEQKKRKNEEKKVAQLKKEQAEIENKKKKEEEKKKAAEVEKKKKEELEKKKEQERLRKEEEELKRKQEEALLQEELEEEQRQQEAAQLSRDQQLLQNIVVNIKRSIVSNFNKSGLPPGLECVLSVRLVPGGEVISVNISKPSGNDVFDQRALTAVQKASPLPIPEDVATFERLRLRKFAFRFRPED
ncbi:MAG: cell envelope integrity protein TolA [Gammaproteobacteria bacterium]|jgi:colicin import membrane protein|nr:cell envelope integrity protein TolA [Gammaproteobacteria bacterium]